MPSAQRACRVDAVAADPLGRAGRTGDRTAWIIERRPHPEQGSSLIMRLGQQYGNDRLDAASAARWHSAPTAIAPSRTFSPPARTVCLWNRRPRQPRRPRTPTSATTTLLEQTVDTQRHDWARWPTPSSNNCRAARPPRWLRGAFRPAGRRRVDGPRTAQAAGACRRPSCVATLEAVDHACPTAQRQQVLTLGT